MVMVYSRHTCTEKINVKVGQVIEVGQRIATVGSTGYVTGPHLDVSLYIDATALDPLSLLSLPLR